MANPLAFSTIYQTVMKAIADAQYSRTDEVKAVVNMIYLNEICQCDDLYPLFWLLDCDDSKKAKAPATITGITAANPPVVTAAAHGFATGDVITIYDVAGMTEVNNRNYYITRLTADTFTLHDLKKANILASTYTAYTSGGTAHHRGLLITSCSRVLLANWHGYNKGLSFIGSEQIETEATWMDKGTSIPLKIMHRKIYNNDGDQYDYLLWFQGADAAYDLRLWTEIQPTLLEDASDVPLLPSQFHHAIIAGAIVRLGENKTQVEAGVVWPAIYNTHIDSIKTFNRKWWQETKPFERSAHFLI